MRTQIVTLTLTLVLVLGLTARAAAQTPADSLAPAPQGYAQLPPPGYAPPSVAPPRDASPYARPNLGGYGAYAPARGPQLEGAMHVEMQPDHDLWTAGLGLFIAGYVLDFLITPVANAISNDRPPAVEQDAWAWSLLPFAGPIVQLAIQAPHPAIPITAGLLEIGGLVLFVMGMTSRHRVEVPGIALGDPSSPTTPRLAFDAAPTAGGVRAGATLTF